LTTRPPRKTWLQPSPRSICSAKGPACVVFGAAWLLVAVFLLPRTGARFAIAVFASSHFTQPRYFAVWLPPQLQHRGCPRGAGHPPERWEPQHATHRGAYPQLLCVCPKRRQRLHCSGPFGARYVSTVTRRPQGWLIEGTLDTSGPRATKTMK
jgi:hypothetical protein